MSRLKIVVVDPNPRVTLSAHRILSGECHDVFAANGIADAVRITQREKPDVVVLDAELAAPYTLRELAQATHHELALVLTSTHSTTMTPEVMEGVRIVGVVEKPFSAGALVDAVEIVDEFEEPTLSGIDALDDALFATAQDTPEADPPEATLEISLEPPAATTPEVVVVHDSRDATVQIVPADLDFIHRAQPPGATSAPDAATELGAAAAETQDAATALGSAAVEADEHGVDTEESLEEAPRAPSAQHVFDTIEDDPDVTPRARQLADRICHEFPGLGQDAIHRRLLDRACALALEDEAEKAPLTRGQVVLQGSVGPVPVEQVFHLAENMPGRTGLTFTRGEQRIELYFEDRYLVFARGEGLSPGYALGAFLVDQGAIEPEDFEKFLAEQSSPFIRIGEQLVRHGYVEIEAVKNALVAQVQLYASEAIRWIGSTFSIQRDVDLPEPATTADVQLPVAFVLLEGMRQLDEWDRVIEQIGGLSAVPVRLDTEETAALSPRERHLLSHVDGTRSVEDVAKRACRPTFDVCCSLAELRGRRLLTVA
ncbi:MAG: DUF4388 domain-containing protein [Deltaproteobacteria bacterium]|jgi:CheY-like chemotaxis protein